MQAGQASAALVAEYELRPFFVEGSQVFRRPGASPCSLFYSRRTGKRPGPFAEPPDAAAAYRPDATTILGAAKVTGKVGGKTTIRVIKTGASPEYATVRRVQTDRVGGQRQVDWGRLIEPLTDYFVGRSQELVRWRPGDVRGPRGCGVSRLRSAGLEPSPARQRISCRGPDRRYSRGGGGHCYENAIAKACATCGLPARRSRSVIAGAGQSAIAGGGS